MASAQIAHEKGAEIKSDQDENDEQNMKKFFAQMEVPLRKKTHRLDPTFFKCDGKIVKYDSASLNIWRVSQYTTPCFFC